jgi:hypothetical protein
MKDADHTCCLRKERGGFLSHSLHIAKKKKKIAAHGLIAFHLCTWLKGAFVPWGLSPKHAPMIHIGCPSYFSPLNSIQLGFNPDSWPSPLAQQAVRIGHCHLQLPPLAAANRHFRRVSRHFSEKKRSQSCSQNEAKVAHFIFLSP